MSALVLAPLLHGCVGGFSEIEAVGKTGEDFLTAMKDGDATSSFGLLDEDLQKKMGGLPGWSEERKKLVPTSWNYEALDVQADTGLRTLKYSATLQNGGPHAIELVMEKSGADWKLIGIKVSPTK